MNLLNDNLDDLQSLIMTNTEPSAPEELREAYILAAIDHDGDYADYDINRHGGYQDEMQQTHLITFSNFVAAQVVSEFMPIGRFLKWGIISLPWTTILTIADIEQYHYITHLDVKGAHNIHVKQAWKNKSSYRLVRPIRELWASDIHDEL